MKETETDLSDVSNSMPHGHFKAAPEGGQPEVYLGERTTTPNLPVRLPRLQGSLLGRKDDNSQLGDLDESGRPEVYLGERTTTPN